MTPPRQTDSADPPAPRNTYLVPTVIEQDGRGERAFDIYSRLLKDRIVFIGTPIDDFVANSVIAQMLFLQMADPKKDIHVYINSPGGSVTSGLAVYDTMQFVTCDVNTYCIGIAASMGAILLTAGTKGKRFCLPNAHVMIHQVSGGAQGSASDVERTVEFMFNLKSASTASSPNTPANRSTRSMSTPTGTITCPPMRPPHTASSTASSKTERNSPTKPAPKKAGRVLEIQNPSRMSQGFWAPFR